MGVIADVETSVISSFTAVANAFGGGLLATFRPAFIIGFTIWITLIAYEVAFGKSEDGFTYLLTKIGKIFLIGVLALYGWPELAELLNGVKDGFVGAGTISSILETSLANPYFAMYEGLFTWAGSVISQAASGFAVINVVKMLMVLAFVALLALVFLCFGIVLAVICAIAMATFLIANSVFVLLLAVGPFFLLCLAFPFMQRFFETYIGNVMTAILGMAFAVLMVNFIASLVGFASNGVLYPAAPDADTAIANIKTILVYFAAQTLKLALITYLYFKIFDLAAALGGGLNMGNNLVGGVRSILRDVQRNAGGRALAGTSANTIAQGRSAASGSSSRAARANSTFTGMAMSAAAPLLAAPMQAASAAMRMIGGGAANLGRIGSYGAGRAAGSIGRFAYNRHSQHSNRITTNG
ncbi:MAG: type IV secretion system protein [Burkholderiaceae bacterium]